MTFTLRSAVKSIRAHITGRPKVEILLMLTGGHTDYMKKKTKNKTWNKKHWRQTSGNQKESKRSIAFKRKRKVLLHSEQLLYKKKCTPPIFGPSVLYIVAKKHH